MHFYGTFAFSDVFLINQARRLLQVHYWRPLHGKSSPVFTIHQTVSTVAHHKPSHSTSSPESVTAHEADTSVLCVFIFCSWAFLLAAPVSETADLLLCRVLGRSSTTSLTRGGGGCVKTHWLIVDWLILFCPSSRGLFRDSGGRVVSTSTSHQCGPGSLTPSGLG